MKVIGELTKASNLGEYEWHTPWCSQLDIHAPAEIAHFYYSVSDLQQEIEMRTSYLGKLRRTEEAEHLLDLLELSKDETELFEGYMTAAMYDVFDSIRTAAINVKSACVLEGDDANDEDLGVDFSNSIHYTIELCDHFDRNMVGPLDNAITEALVNRIIYKWVLLAYPAESESYAMQFAEANTDIRNRLAARAKHLQVIPRPF